MISAWEKYKFESYWVFYVNVDNFIDLISWIRRQHLQRRCRMDKSKWYIDGVFRVNEWKRCVTLKPSKIVLHACQSEQVNRTSGSLEQRVLRGVLLHVLKHPRTRHQERPFSVSTAMFIAIFQTFCGEIVAFQFWLNEFWAFYCVRGASQAHFRYDVGKTARCSMVALVSTS